MSPSALCDRNDFNRGRSRLDNLLVNCAALQRGLRKDFSALFVDDGGFLAACV